MSVVKITPKYIIALRKKRPELGTILKACISKTKKNANKNFPTYYIPVDLIDDNGDRRKLRLSILNQLVAKDARPFGSDEKTIAEATAVYIQFMKFLLGDLDITTYDDDDKSGLIANNHELLEALIIIAEEYDYIVKNEILTYDGDKFDIGTKGADSICNFIQTERAASDEEKKEDAKRPAGEKIIKNKMIKLQNPIARIKLNANKDTKRIGRDNFTTKKHEDIVFDLSKESTDPKKKFDVAKLMDSKGKLVNLTVTNIKHFITRMSLIAGVIDFSEICVSKKNISLKNEFTEIFVVPHAPIKNKGMDEEDIASMTSIKSAKPSVMTITDEPADSDDEDDDDEDEPEEEPEEDVARNKKSKNNSSATSKKAAPVVVKTGKAASKPVSKSKVSAVEPTVSSTKDKRNAKAPVEEPDDQDEQELSDEPLATDEPEEQVEPDAEDEAEPEAEDSEDAADTVDEPVKKPIVDVTVPDKKSPSKTAAVPKLQNKVTAKAANEKPAVKKTVTKTVNK